MLDLPDCIDTPRLVVRRLRESDLPDLLVVNDNADVNRFLPYKQWRGLDDAAAWHARMVALQANGDAVQFVIVDRRDRRVIGTVLVFRHDPVAASAELGYALGRNHWGRGLMSEALRAVIGAAARCPDLRRLNAVVDRDNAPSLATLQRMGFRFVAAVADSTLVTWALAPLPHQDGGEHTAAAF